MLPARAAFKSKRQIEELVAELSPKPDVPALVRKLPKRRRKTKPMADQLGPDRVAAITPAPAQPSVVTPIAPARYKVQFTTSAELHDKLERLRALMRSSVPDGDLASLIEESVTEKPERLESKRFGRTKAPRKSLEETDTSADSRYIPAAVRRAVWARDGGQCTFVDEGGRRCTHRDRLEFHHLKPFGRGGDHSAENIYLLCRTHNGFLAECDYGTDLIDRYRRSSSRVSEPSAAYAIGWTTMI